MPEIQNDAFRLIIRLVMTVLLLRLAIYDIHTRRVPNLVVIPLLLVGGGVTLVRLWLGHVSPESIWVLALTVVACLILWRFHAFGGGDVKLIVALIALAPDMQLVYLLLGGTLGGLFLVLAVGDGRQGIRRMMALLANAGHGVLPDRAEIMAAYQSRGRPITFAFCLAAVAYLWIFWTKI
jgi:prepilin peptidase CpaA